MMKEAFPPELPYGFAERVAYSVTSKGGATIWDFLLNLTPRTSLALGAIATILLLFGLTGDGPGLFDSVTQYNSLSSFFSIP
jgi:hypothetical protein